VLTGYSRFNGMSGLLYWL